MIPQSHLLRLLGHSKATVGIVQGAYCVGGGGSIAGTFTNPPTPGNTVLFVASGQEAWDIFGETPATTTLFGPYHPVQQTAWAGYRTVLAGDGESFNMSITYGSSADTAGYILELQGQPRFSVQYGLSTVVGSGPWTVSTPTVVCDTRSVAVVEMVTVYVLPSSVSPSATGGLYANRSCWAAYWANTAIGGPVVVTYTGSAPTSQPAPVYATIVASY